MALVLGISAFYHDASATLLRDGDIIAAAQEERFTRIKNDAGFPQQAIEYCLAEAGTRLCDVDHIVFYEKPFLKFERLLDSYMAFAPKGFRSFARAMPVWIKEKLFQKRSLLQHLTGQDSDFRDKGQLRFCDHHLSHCASAYFPSPFDEALVLSIDGVGEWATTAMAIGQGNDLVIHKELHFPHSLGLLYSAFTQYLGFRVNYDEYKVMGLAPYGCPIYCDQIRNHLIDQKSDGSFWLDQRYFDYAVGLRMTNKRFEALFDAPCRAKEAPIEQFHMDIACSIQQVCEEVVIGMATHLRAEFGLRNLCLAGGVAQNSVINGLLANSGLFEQVWVQPAAGDCGGSLGAALAYHYIVQDRPRRAQTPDAMKSALLGPGFSQSDIEARLSRLGAEFDVLPDADLLPLVARDIADGKVVAWFDGRLEFGPRALGSRSILGDPRSDTMQQTINAKVKGREGFRPFAPAVLEERAAEWFDLEQTSPYMGMVAPVAHNKQVEPDPEQAAKTGFEMLRVRRSVIPAVTHVNTTARIQTVNATATPRFHALISAFQAITGCPMLLNTSFNMRDEPIVCTPQEAYRGFEQTNIDILICGNCILRKG